MFDTGYTPVCLDEVLGSWLKVALHEQGVGPDGLWRSCPISALWWVSCDPAVTRLRL